MTEENKPPIFSRDDIHAVEVRVGFCAACILTLAFIAPLTLCQSFSLYFFVISLTSQTVLVIEFYRVTRPPDGQAVVQPNGAQERAYLIVTAIADGSMLVALGLLLWGMSRISVVLFAVVPISLTTYFEMIRKSKK
jgi:hypothetical protein